MKKTASLQFLKSPTNESKASYYRSIGEQAALHTFRRNPTTQKILLPSPGNKSSLKEDLKKSEFDWNTGKVSGRDVSHLLDRLKTPVSRINELPTDIKTLKKLLENSDPLGNPLNKGQPLSCSCRKEVCMDSVYKQNNELPSIEKLYLGPPTGRQECSNLKKWFETMKETYCVDGGSEENSRILFSMCSKELIRQVSVNCTERGELLQEVFEFFINSYEKSRENSKNVEKNSERIKNENRESYEKKEKDLREVVQKTEEKNNDLSMQLKAQNKEIERLNELVRVASEKLDDFSYKFNEEKSLRVIHSIRKSSYNSPSQRKRFRPSFIHSHLVKYPKNEFLLRFDKADQTIPEQKKSQFFNLQTLIEEEKIKFETDKKSLFSDKEAQTHRFLEVFCDPIILSANLFESKKSELIDNIEYKSQEFEQNNKDYENLEKLNLLETDELSIRKTAREEFSTKKNNFEDSSLNLFSNESSKTGELTPTINAITAKSFTTGQLVVKNQKAQSIDFNIKLLKDLEDSIAKKQAQYHLLEKKIEEKVVELSTLTKQVLSNEEKSIKSSDFPTSQKEKVIKPLSFNQNSTMDVVEEQENVNNYSVLIQKDASLSIYEEENNEEGSNIRKSLSQSFLTPKKEHKKRLSASNISNLSDEDLSQRSDSQKNEEIPDKEANESRIESFEDYHNTSIYEGKKSGNEHKQRQFNPTEVFEFRFNQRRHKDINKKNPGKKILLTVLSKKIEWIKSKATMSKKMMNKLMSSLYISYFSKEDYSESLLNFTFFEFSQRFGFKKVIEKKFVEFICSLIYFQDSRRCRNFLRFISAGATINKKNFSKDSLKVYLSALNFMMNSKVGLASFDDSLDKILIPLVRATEYFKEKLENFGKLLTNKMISIIEKKAIPDPKKINGSGVVETELVLETLAENYEELRDQVITGVEFLINTINYKEDKLVFKKYLVSLIFRWACPQKLDDADSYFSDKDEVTSEEFCDYCIEKLVLSMNELNGFYPDPNKTAEETQQILNQSKVFEIFQEISKSNKLAGLVSNEFWETKLKNLTVENDRSPYETLFALHLYSNELERIRSVSW